MTAAKSLLVPLRFMSLILNLVVAAELFVPERTDNQLVIAAGCIIGLSVFELFGLMTGLSLEQDIQGLWSAGLHLISIFLLLFHLMENWSTQSLWYIIGFLNVPSFITELIIIVRTVVYRKI